MATNNGKVINFKNPSTGEYYVASGNTNSTKDNSGVSVETSISDLKTQVSRKLDATAITQTRIAAMDSGITSTKVTALDNLIALGISFNPTSNLLTIGGKTYNLADGTGGSDSGSGGDSGVSTPSYEIPVVDSLGYTQLAIPSSGGITTYNPTIKISQYVTSNGNTTKLEYTSISEARADGVAFNFYIDTSISGISVNSATGELTVGANASASSRSFKVKLIVSMNGKNSASKESNTITQDGNASSQIDVLLRKEVSYVKISSTQRKYVISEVRSGTGGTETSKVAEENIVSTSVTANKVYNHMLETDENGVVQEYTSATHDDADLFMLSDYIPCEKALTMSAVNALYDKHWFFYKENSNGEKVFVGYCEYNPTNSSAYHNVTEQSVPAGAQFVRINIPKNESYKCIIKYKD